MSTLPLHDTQNAQGTHDGNGAAGARASLAICLPSMPSDVLAGMLARLQQIFPAEPLLIATPDQAEEQAIGDGHVHLVPYPVHRTESAWVLNAADYLAAARLAEQRGLAGVLLLGTDSTSLDSDAIVNLRQTLASGVDLVVPRYQAGPQEGLVNSALLYPLTRALFGVDVRFPLPLDAALSTRLLSRLAIVASRSSAPSDDGLVWPVAEASIAGFTVRQIEGVERSIPRPGETDLNVLFPSVTSSVFADIESKATYWQRARTLSAERSAASTISDTGLPDMDEVRSLVDNFRLAFSNLREIWALVLPPQTLLSLKKLSLTPAETFSFAPNLWARVVYDFAMAFHLRTLNRGHLLGAMTPLYLAWVASLLREAGGPGESNLLERTVTAFEQEKPYLVSRWRWPDRFNP